MQGSILLQGSQDLFCLSFCSSATVESGGKRGNDRYEVAHQVGFLGICGVDDHQFPILHREQGLDVSDPETGCAVLMLYNDPANLSGRQQGQKLGPLIVDPAPTLFDDLGNSPPLCIAPANQPLSLRV